MLCESAGEASSKADIFIVDLLKLPRIWLSKQAWHSHSFAESAQMTLHCCQSGSVACISLTNTPQGRKSQVTLRSKQEQTHPAATTARKRSNNMQPCGSGRRACIPRLNADVLDIVEHCDFAGLGPMHQTHEKNKHQNFGMQT